MTTLGSSGDYLGADACRRADGGIPDGGFLGQVYAGAEFAATITAPVMKGRRGGQFRTATFGRMFIGWPHHSVDDSRTTGYGQITVHGNKNSDPKVAVCA